MEEAAPLGHILLVAGHDTSANMTALGAALLLQNPDQLPGLREHADDPKYVTSAVEELLRYLTIPHLLARRAVVEDIEIDGETIRAGEGVIASTWSRSMSPWQWHGTASTAPRGSRPTRSSSSAPGPSGWAPPSG
ncbi:cytochrome P450 [Streptomyces sp. NPDC002896]|uniref:cytochrome P450 n=1 Tax=Streptomyces sp. NPDC002896 TaxID=3154438 RepID=UPI0033300000